MEKLIKFDVESATMMEEDPTSRFAWAKIQAFSSDANRHDLYCDEETLKRTAPTIYNTPIMYDVVRQTQDFGTHTEAGKSMIAGFAVPNSAEFIRLPDGRLSFTILARIWKMYAPKVMEFFKRNDERKVSVEMELLDTEPMPDGLTKMKDFVYTGIQLLGQTVLEASPGANIKMLSFSEEFEEYEKAVLQEFSDELDFTIPDTVKKNSLMAIEYHKEKGGINSVNLASARYLSKNSKASAEKIKSVYKFLSSHKDKSTSEKSQISYLCYGGNEAYDWSKDLVERMEALENKRVAYFSEVATETQKEEKIVEDEKDDVKMDAEVMDDEMMAAETPAEEKAEDPKEEATETKDEEKKEEMSLDSNLDVAACLAMLDNETEDYQALVDSQASGKMDYAKLCYAMYSKMSKMSEDMTKMSADNKAYMDEMSALKAFKADVETKQFSFEVDATLNEVADSMPKDKLEEAKQDAVNFSMATVDAWKNKVKAIAFSFAKEKKEKPTGFALPVVTEKSTRNSNLLWG